MIPTREQCFELIQRYKMLPHIVRHSELVTDVALLIARELNKHGQHLDLALIEAGALLHDITKTMSIQTMEDHAQTGGELLTSLGYPAVANIVRQHIRVDPGTSDPDAVTEAEVVNYADKRVKHEEVVDIEERFRDVLNRYAKKVSGLRARLEKVQRETRLLEEKIFSKINILPEQIKDIVSNP
ncbi:MAG: HDIG domain-containing protein [Deltaproteobacteria bacterium]|nr:HDIG domain-containing protein [Deltaproteobacteria bacterium]MBW2019337.1 HDIG domain-containing protein [Deltaproteobacteria bacterium]